MLLKLSRKSIDALVIFVAVYAVLCARTAGREPEKRDHAILID
jgi:hypothetical protein